MLVLWQGLQARKIAQVTHHKNTSGETMEGWRRDRTARNKKRIEQQKALPRVECEGNPIDNVWSFKYLGAQFRADGDNMIDVKARIAKAMRTAGQMCNIWTSRHVSLRLKIRLYKAAVCSQLTYGSEVWELTDEATKAINGANSRMMSRITGKSIHEEASPSTRTFV